LLSQGQLGITAARLLDAGKELLGGLAGGVPLVGDAGASSSRVGVLILSASIQATARKRAWDKGSPVAVPVYRRR